MQQRIRCEHHRCTAETGDEARSQSQLNGRPTVEEFVTAFEHDR